MRKNQIKTLRMARAISAEQLAELVGISQGHMSRIENGVRGLSYEMAEKVAMVLGTNVENVFGNTLRNSADPEPKGMHEDVEPYIPQPDDAFTVAPKKRQNVDPWLVKSNAVDQTDIRPGDIVYVDISTEAVESVQSLKIVVAQHYGAGLTTARSIMRQFIAPNLLITNSSESNEIPLSTDKDDVHIKGVVVGRHRPI